MEIGNVLQKKESIWPPQISEEEIHEQIIGQFFFAERAIKAQLKLSVMF